MMKTPSTTLTKALPMGIIPHIHHKPYLPIQKQKQFLELQNVKRHTQRKLQVQKLNFFYSTK
jgi:hypothetical protein